jgi:histidinol-phosphate aminotransferase
MIKPKKTINNLYRMKDNEFISRYGKIRLDRNERTIEFNKLIVEKIKDSITDEMLMIYPEPYPLYKKFEEVFNIKQENLIFNLGSDLSIKSIYETYIEENDTILLHEPSYAMYKVYADMFGANIITQNFENDFSFDYNSFIEKINDGIKMVVFENPNGFIGVDHTKENILKIIEKAYKHNVLVVIDEAYYHFIKTTMIEYIHKFDNLIIVRTFSKALGLASCRIGYIVSCSNNIDNIFKVKPMHELTQFSINAALIILDNFELVMKNIEDVLDSLDYLKKELNNIGCEYSNSVANFLVAKLNIKNYQKFIEEIIENNILIRRNFTQDFLKEYIRIGVSKKSDIDKFIKIVRRYNEM